MVERANMVDEAVTQREPSIFLRITRSVLWKLSTIISVQFDLKSVPGVKQNPFATFRSIIPSHRQESIMQ